MGKCYKALIDSGATISLVRYCMYQTIDNSLKTAIQAPLIQLNTVHGSPMTALGIMTLQPRIEDFKFSNNFIVCDRLSKTELLFGIDVQKKFSPSYAWDKEKNCYIQKKGRFLTYARNCKQKANIAVVKLALKILPRHNGIVPIKSKGHVIKGHTVVLHQWSGLQKKERPQHTHHWQTSITSKKKHMLMFLFQHYTNKYITFNKGGICRTSGTTYRRHATDSRRFRIINDIAVPPQKGWWLRRLNQITFKPPCLKLRNDIKTEIVELLKEYQSQFAPWWNHHWGTKPVTEMMTDTRFSEPVSQKPYPIVMKHYKWVKDESNKLLTAKVIQWSWSRWLAPIIVVLKGRWRKISSHWLPWTQQDHTKISLAYAKGRRHFCQTQWHEHTSQPWIYEWDITTSHWISHQYPKQPSPCHLENMNILRYPSDLLKHLHIFQELMAGVLKVFCFAIAYLDDKSIFSRMAEQHLDHIRQVFKKLWNAKLSMKLSKCHFFAKDIKYLGHILSTTGIRPLPLKTQAINNMQPPRHS